MSAESTAPAGRRFFGDLGVNLKILLAITTAVIVAVIVGVVGLSALSRASESAQLLYRSNVASVRAVGELSRVLAQARLDAAMHLISQDPASEAKNIAAFEEDRKAFTEALAAYRASQPAGDPALIAQVDADWQKYVNIAENRLRPLGACM